MTVFEELIKDVATFTLLLFSPVILYIVWFSIRYLFCWLTKRRRPHVL